MASTRSTPAAPRSLTTDVIRRAAPRRVCGPTRQSSHVWSNDGGSEKAAVVVFGVVVTVMMMVMMLTRGCGVSYGGLVLILCAALDGVQLADGVGSLLREIRSHAGSVT